MGQLNGKIAVITGSTRGLGLAMAQAFCREGAAVVVASRSAQTVEKVSAQLRAAGSKAAGIACDVADFEQVKALGQFAIDTFGRFDVWVNNAVLSGPYGPAMEIDPQVFEQTVQANIMGYYYGSWVALRHFLPRRSGKLINIMGRGSREPVPMQIPYAATKAYIRNFTLALAQENKDSGVGIFAYNPGMMDTDLIQRTDVIAGYEDRLNSLGTILRMWSQPPEIPAEKAVWLASPATDGKTGLEIRTMTPGKMLGGALGEVGRRILRRPGKQVNIQVESVPPALNLTQPKKK
jgi:glucose 1-dehydrogenase